MAVEDETSFGRYSFTYGVNVSMMKRMYLNCFATSSGPMVTIAMRCIGFSMERTNRDALMALCRVSILTCRAAHDVFPDVVSQTGPILR